MWKASIDSNWSKEGHLGPREFVEVTKASPNSNWKDPRLDQRVLSSNTIEDPKPYIVLMRGTLGGLLPYTNFGGTFFYLCIN